MYPRGNAKRPVSMVLLLLTSVRTELMTEWQATPPASAPNHCLINMRPDGRDALGAMLGAAGDPEPTRRAIMPR